MSKSTIIARPYAKALFEIALQQRTLTAWSALLQLAAVVVKQPVVQALLDNPQVSSTQVCDFLIRICKTQLTPEGENFFRLLAERDRLAITPEITELFAAYRAEQEKLMKVQVRTALPLSKEEQGHLIKVLQKRLHREIELECQLDKNLIGGLIIQAEDLVMDGSIRGKLNRLQTELLS